MSWRTFWVVFVIGCGLVLGAALLAGWVALWMSWLGPTFGTIPAMLPFVVLFAALVAWDGNG